MVKLYSYFSFCYLENTLKDRLSKTSGWQFRKWLFGPEKFSGLSRNAPQEKGTVLIFVRAPTFPGNHKPYKVYITLAIENAQ